MGKSARIAGIAVGKRDCFEDMYEAIDIARLRPVVGTTFGFHEARNAFATMIRQTVVGKIVVDLAGG